ncbi:MAG: aminotransferase class V-fold PLP-dependent enzyme [Burkholderiales bacterium]|nr:aminotransferase class V-fold PLP-dependent enzyme [Burkholderiales bacterium]
MRVPIYLDYAATTPVDPGVAAAMLPWLSERFGNPASRSHAPGWQAADAVATARAQVAALAHCMPEDIVWTSGATESINLALKGAAQAAGDKRHFVTLASEHPATLDAMRALEREGHAISVVPVEADGLVDLDRLRAALRPDTLLLSVMAVNNEIGVRQALADIAALTEARGILLHVDAAQASGKVALDLSALPIDLMSFSAHKTYGPKGIGALFVRRAVRSRLAAQMHGGGQEQGLRAGTLATHQIVGMGEAFALAGSLQASENARIVALRERLLGALADVPGLRVNGDAVARVPHNLNLSFVGHDAEALMLAMPELALSSGAACASGHAGGSHVLRAIGCDDAAVHGALRITLGRFTTEDEIDIAARVLRRALGLANAREAPPAALSSALPEVARRGTPVSAGTSEALGGH